MSVGTALAVLKMLLSLASWFARQAEKHEIERNLINELKTLQGERVDRANDARDDVLNGRVPADPDDPFRRD